MDAASALEALTGLSHGAARQLVDLRFAIAPEVDALLDRMHEMLRSLAIATTSTPVRTAGEVRGPVLWSETVAARASSPGAGGVFVCATPSKAYDTEENRVLVHALVKIRDAARAADPAAQPVGPEDALRRARHNGTRAVRAMEHRTLAAVSRARPDGRAMRKARSGSKARSYRSAVAALERCADPLTGDEVHVLADARSRRQHGVVLALLDALGGRPHVELGTIHAGPLRYRRRLDGAPAIALGDLVLDVPERPDADPVAAEAALVAAAGGRPALLVQRPADIQRALRLCRLG